VISLTPQRSAPQKGVVDILARFQVTGSSTVTGINFQVAVPKVRSPPAQTVRYIFIDDVVPPDSAAANATHVASGRQSGNDRDATDAHHCAGWCKFVFVISELRLPSLPPSLNTLLPQ